MNTNDPITIRLSKPTDLDFIYGSWLPTEWAATPANLSSHQAYKHDQKKKIDFLLHHSQVMMAELDPIDNEEILLAYIVYQYAKEHLIIHYAFTKSPFRKQGIQTKLLSNINLLHQPIVLTAQPNKTILNSIQKTNNIIYDHFYFQRPTYTE